MTTRPIRAFHQPVSLPSPRRFAPRLGHSPAGERLSLGGESKAPSHARLLRDRAAHPRRLRARRRDRRPRPAPRSPPHRHPTLPRRAPGRRLRRRPEPRRVLAHHASLQARKQPQPRASEAERCVELRARERAPKARVTVTVCSNASSASSSKRSRDDQLAFRRYCSSRAVTISTTLRC